MSDLAYLGKGIKFPFRFNERTGGTQESRGLDRIRESIIQILETRLGERLKRPEFGSKVKDLALRTERRGTERPSALSRGRGD